MPTDLSNIDVASVYNEFMRLKYGKLCNTMW